MIQRRQYTHLDYFVAKLGEVRVGFAQGRDFLIGSGGHGVAHAIGGQLGLHGHHNFFEPEFGRIDISAARPGVGFARNHGFHHFQRLVGRTLEGAATTKLDDALTALAGALLDVGPDVFGEFIGANQVGERLALWALAKDYGQKDRVCCGPIYQGMEVEGGKIRLSFDHTGSGLVAKDSALANFVIAGADKKFVSAKATIETKTVVVSSDTVAAPVAVRYAFDNAGVPSLLNKEGLPASSFRTDEW